MATLELTDINQGSRLIRIKRLLRELKLPWIPITILTILVICSAFAPLLAPHDPQDLNVKERKTAPGTTWEFPLGADMLGRDMLSRLIYGARTSVFISLVALGAGALVGTIIGVCSGYFGVAVPT